MRMAAHDAAMRADSCVQQERGRRTRLTGLRITRVERGDSEIDAAAQRGSPDPHADMEFLRFPIAHQDNRAAEAVVGRELQIDRQRSGVANAEPEDERGALRPSILEGLRMYDGEQAFFFEADGIQAKRMLVE